LYAFGLLIPAWSFLVVLPAIVDPFSGAGVESMTFGYGAGALGELSEEVLADQNAEDCLFVTHGYHL